MKLLRPVRAGRAAVESIPVGTDFSDFEKNCDRSGRTSPPRRRPRGIGRKKSCGDEACEEVVVPSGDFAPQTDLRQFRPEWGAQIVDMIDSGVAFSRKRGAT
jgi:hypothetical protein